MTDEYFHQERNRQTAAIAQMKERLRPVRPHASISGRSVILTDDRVATGAMLIAALRRVRVEEPAELIAVVPVIPMDCVRVLHKHCDRLVFLLAAQHIWAVGQFYQDFPPVDDEQVIELLRAPTPQLVE